MDNPLFVQRLNGSIANFASKTGDYFGATKMAYAQLEGLVAKQAYYLAYLDTYRVVSLFFVAIFPLLLLLRTKKKTKEEIAAAAKAAADSH